MTTSNHARPPRALQRARHHAGPPASILPQGKIALPGHQSDQLRLRHQIHSSQPPSSRRWSLPRRLICIPPSNDAGGAAPPSSEPLPDGATLDATTDSDDEGDEGDHATPLRGHPKLQTARINRDALLLFCNDASAPPPDVRCCDTPNKSDSLQDLTSDKIYHLFGNRGFRNYEHFGRVSKDAKFVQGHSTTRVPQERCSGLGTTSVPPPQSSPK